MARHKANWTRRDWQAACGAMALGLAARPIPAASSPALADGDWIDAHVHVWTPDLDRYPIQSQFTVEQMVPRSFTPEELFAHCRPSGVQRVVLIQMSYYGTDNRYMLDQIAAYPGVFSGVGIVDHRIEQLPEAIDHLAEHGVKGLRIHPTSADEAKEWVQDAGMNRLWSHCGKTGVAVCPLINPGDLEAIDQLAEKHRDTTVVIDHFARIGVSGSIEEDRLQKLCSLARHPKCYVKTSAFYALGKKQAPHDDLIPMIRRVLDAYGPQRLMWASDCPYQVQAPHAYDPSIALVRDRIDFLSPSDRKWMLRDTAAKVFF